MKKVVALHSSKRKQNTYGVLLQIKEILKKSDVDMEIISLYDLDIKDCVGCEVCVLRDKCVLNDDTQKLMQKLIEADGIVLSSPVYLMQVSGKMKTFIDRTCSWFHRPKLMGKPILSVATTKGSGLKMTTDYLDKVCEQWGAMNTHAIGKSIRTIDEKIDEKALSEFVKLLDNPELYRPRLSNLINFEVQKALAFKIQGLDVKYWQDNGFDKRAYYFDCRINPFKKIISTLVGKILRKAMSKSNIT